MLIRNKAYLLSIETHSDYTISSNILGYTGTLTGLQSNSKRALMWLAIKWKLVFIPLGPPTTRMDTARSLK